MRGTPLATQRGADVTLFRACIRFAYYAQLVLGRELPPLRPLHQLRVGGRLVSPTYDAFPILRFDTLPIPIVPSGSVNFVV